MQENLFKPRRVEERIKNFSLLQLNILKNQELYTHLSEFYKDGIKTIVYNCETKKYLTCYIEGNIHYDGVLWFICNEDDVENYIEKKFYTYIIVEIVYTENSITKSHLKLKISYWNDELKHWEIPFI